ncbi:DNA repair protein RadC [Paenibacillus elgii]|uniref:DNA repair protein RadC n=1 Tax=Paenibacillus elgii TaxID=189691 RepID=A0A2T6G0I6_9BACL|nr:JAB domain-containing protein [Paenibacillus elgii]PUA37669.1 DNA repair protein RadC [Paenibacillus elgii]
MKRLNVISLRMVRESTYRFETNKIRCPNDAYKLVTEYLRDVDREYCLLLCLSSRNTITALEVVSIGSLDAALVTPREIFKSAILSNSACIILAHAHPSGDTTPSQDDIEFTARVKSAGEIIGIELLDHIIVADGQHYSLRENGLM